MILLMPSTILLANFFIYNRILLSRAPVIGIAVLDGSNKPLPEPLEVEKGVAPLPDTTQAHRVVIASEEQFKIFTLPSLKPYGKYKLTANEGKFNCCGNKWDFFVICVATYRSQGQTNGICHILMPVTRRCHRETFRSGSFVPYQSRWLRRS